MGTNSFLHCTGVDCFQNLVHRCIASSISIPQKQRPHVFFFKSRWVWCSFGGFPKKMVVRTPHFTPQNVDIFSRKTPWACWGKPTIFFQNLQLSRLRCWKATLQGRGSGSTWGCWRKWPRFWWEDLLKLKPTLKNRNVSLETVVFFRKHVCMYVWDICICGIHGINVCIYIYIL